MMKNKRKIIALLATALSLSSTYANAEEDFLGWLFTIQRQKNFKPVSDKLYQEECGACHFAYQPGLLPSRSWELLLNAEALKKHYGMNAELDEEALKVIHDYAVDNAADKSWYKRSRKIAVANEDGPAPLRITELRYISLKHRNISEKMIKGNKGVKSLSFCDRCHTQAEKGIYDSDTVSIPNYPGWDD